MSNDAKDGGRGPYSVCLMLIKFSEEYRRNLSRIVPLIKQLSDEYMQRYALDEPSTPDSICEGALTGEFDFYILFKYRADGPVWLAARLHDMGVAAQILTMQAMPRPQFEELFRN